MQMLLSFAAIIAGMISIAGTQNTTSTSSFATNGFNSFTRATASLGVLFIFQLPAIIFLLAISPFLLTFQYINFQIVYIRNINFSEIQLVQKLQKFQIWNQCKADETQTYIAVRQVSSNEAIISYMGLIYNFFRNSISTRQGM